jgi:hypothetical protein
VEVDQKAIGREEAYEVVGTDEGIVRPEVIPTHERDVGGPKDKGVDEDRDRRERWAQDEDREEVVAAEAAEPGERGCEGDSGAVPALRLFDLTSSMTSSGPAYADDTLAFFMFQTTFQSNHFSQGAAICLTVPYLLSIRSEVER